GPPSHRLVDNEVGVPSTFAGLPAQGTSCQDRNIAHRVLRSVPFLRPAGLSAERLSLRRHLPGGRTFSPSPAWLCLPHLPPNQHTVMAYTTTKPDYTLRVTIEYEDETGYQWRRINSSQLKRIG